MAKLRAVSLDMGWTLAYPVESIWSIFARLCTGAGVATAPEDCERLVRSLWSSGQEHAHEQFRSGAAYHDSDSEFVGLFAQMGLLIFGQAGLAERAPELSQRFLAEFWNEQNWSVFPEVPAALKSLRARGLRVGVLSNAPSDLPKMLDRLGLLPHLDFAVVSAVEGVRKPDRRIFERTLERAGVAAEEALHVGDLFLEDILGAGAVGIEALLIERGTRSLFPNFPESAGRSVPADKVVRDLAAVVEVAERLSEHKPRA